MSTDEKILAKLEALEKAVAGDKINGKLGIVDVLEMHRREIYGDAGTQHTGLKEQHLANEKRLRSLEDDRKKIYWMSAGITMTISGAWTAAKAWFKP